MIKRLQNKFDAIRRQVLSRATEGIPPAPKELPITGGFQRVEKAPLSQLPTFGQVEPQPYGSGRLAAR